MLRQAFAYLAASSLAITPVAIQAAQPAPTAAPLSVARAGADTPGASHLEGDDWLPMVLFGLIVLGGILLATDTWPFDDEDPESP